VASKELRVAGEIAPEDPGNELSIALAHKGETPVGGVESHASAPTDEAR
jgi:hypothetical protein